MVVLGEIRNVVKKIVQTFRPERVVLFGSFARQTAGHDSDVDLLVVLPHETGGQCSFSLILTYCHIGQANAYLILRNQALIIEIV